MADIITGIIKLLPMIINFFKKIMRHYRNLRLLGRFSGDEISLVYTDLNTTNPKNDFTVSGNNKASYKIKVCVPLLEIEGCAKIYYSLRKLSYKIKFETATKYNSTEDNTISLGFGNPVSKKILRYC